MRDRIPCRRVGADSEFSESGDARRNSPTSATGTAWERTPWDATQRAACGGL